MIKFTISYLVKHLYDLVIYLNIRANEPKFEPCLGFTSHLKNKKLYLLGPIYYRRGCPICDGKY
jgi:hypothetical protein